MTDRKLIRTGSSRKSWALAGALLLAVPGTHFAQTAGSYPTGDAPLQDAEVTAPLADERASYSFLRTLEGSATAASAGQGIGEPLEVNQPLLTGDLVRVDPSSRLELALSDRNRLYLDADSAVILERLAFSGDREERVTVLRLEGGELLLAVTDEALGDELPRVITSNATVYVQEPGLYRIETGFGSDGAGWTRVVTRRGFAEIVTDRGSSVVRADESIVALGERRANLELSAAEGPDALEVWSRELSDRAERASRSASYVEPHLAYEAAPLDEAGDWIEVESVRYWRPYVSDGWRPYWQGRWDWTPSGYTWISYEPWGWVPYHYGRWCSLPGYGWAWRPGAVYSPAWVYWNWTSGYAGWVPMGYYSHFYNPWYGGGFRYGVYGWAGGGWGIYSDWNFAPVHCFRDRNFRGHMRRGRDMEREYGHRQPPRGLLTTDTRDFRPEHLDRTDRTEDLLHRIGKRYQPRTGGDLPDMTDFVGRKGKLPTEVARVVVPPSGKERGGIRDIGKVAKVAQTPTWKQKESAGDARADRNVGEKESPVRGTAGGIAGAKGGRENPGATSGMMFDKGRGTVPRGTAKSAPQAEARATGATKGDVATTRGTGGIAGSAKGDGTDRGGTTAKGTFPGATGASPRGGTPRALPQAPRTKVGVPGEPGGSRGSSPAGSDRQLWKARGDESAPVQRVVGSVRRPAPGAESGAKTPAVGRGTGTAQRPGTAAATKDATGSTRGRPAHVTPQGKGVEPTYQRPPASGNAGAGKSPMRAGPSGNGSVKSTPPPAYNRPSGTSPRSAPEARTAPRAPSANAGSRGYPGSSPTVKSQPAERSRPSPSYAPPSARPQPSPRSQASPSRPPAVRSQPAPRTQASPSRPPAVRSQPAPRSQPSYGSQGSSGGVRSQPSGKSSSGARSTGKAQSTSGSKSSSRSGQSSPPPAQKKDRNRH